VRSALWLLLLALTAASCVRVNYFRISHFEPVSPAALLELENSDAELQQCLDTLGAPLIVGEVPDGLAMGYGWQDRAHWGIDVGYTFERLFNIRFNYATVDDALRGVLLLFDDNLRLKTIRRGILGDLTRQLRRRPADPGDLDPDSG
jgi:hypothetical protein